VILRAKHRPRWYPWLRETRQEDRGWQEAARGAPGEPAPRPRTAARTPERAPPARYQDAALHRGRDRRDRWVRPLGAGDRCDESGDGPPGRQDGQGRRAVAAEG